MHIRSLKLANYRNYEALELPLDERLTVLLGENAQGKTNVLESIYLCAAGRSHRTVHDGELVRFGAEAAYCGWIWCARAFRGASNSALPPRGAQAGALRRRAHLPHGRFDGLS